MSVSQSRSRDSRGASPGVDGVTVAGQRLGGGCGVHVAGIRPSDRGGLRGVMLLHGRHGGPWAGALGSSCSPFLLIGTEKTSTLMRTCINEHVLGGWGGGVSYGLCFQSI